MNRKKVAAFCAAGIAVPVFFIAPNIPSKKKKAPYFGRNFAHRGLHTRDGSVPENSLEAFRLAAEAGYGIELDVQLSKDGQVVVFHDDTLSRVCGVNARVDEKTYDELRELSLCGTEERIPLFSEVLKTIGGRGPIICELKPGKRNRELCEKTYALISEYPGELCIESFDPFITGWFRIHAPKLFRGQLAMPAHDYASSVSRPLAILLSAVGMNFISRPDFIAYKAGPQPLPVCLTYALGAVRTVWTSHGEENERENDCVIFEFYRPRRKFK